MLLIIVFLILVTGFFAYNTAERVEVTILNTRYVDVPLIVVIVVAFAFGMIASFLIAATYFLRISSDSRQQRRETKRLQAEITALRNRQIDQIDTL
jgi:uncharacterized integral membrane protein